MRILKSTLILFMLAFSIAASAATPIVFKLKPIKLTNGWQVTGTITTDGTLGPLTAANITSWNLQVVQTTDVGWTEKDSNDLNISGVSTDGKGIFVATSPDGVQDGGTLYFSRGGGGGRIPTSAALADFTQLSVNLGFGIGGIAGWQDEILGLNYIGLNRKNHVQYRAASTIVGQPNVFRILVPRLAPPPFQMTMFGTISTDGTVGALLPANIIAWNITARAQDIANYTEKNSTVLFATGVTSDGIVIKVDHAGGQFGMGIGGARPTFVTIADFTDPAFPNGFANYYMGNFGVMGDKSPLVGKGAPTYTVAKQ
jgi:hypothetical protein